MDSMEGRLLSLIEQGFTVSVFADSGRNRDDQGKPYFTTRLTHRAESGRSDLTVSGSGGSFSEASNAALAAAQAYLQASPRQAAE